MQPQHTKKRPAKTGPKTKEKIKVSAKMQIIPPSDAAAPVVFDEDQIAGAVDRPTKPTPIRKKKSPLVGEKSESSVHFALFTFYVLLGPARSIDALCADIRSRVRSGEVPESYLISPQKGLCLEEAFAWKRRAQDIDNRINHKLDSVIENAAVQNIKLARDIIGTELTRFKALQDSEEGPILIKSASDLKTIIQLDHWLMTASKEMTDIDAKASAAGVPGSLAEQAVSRAGSNVATALELLKNVKSKIDIGI